MSNESTPNDKPPVKNPVVLCILDGWGCREAREDNAIALARTPHWDRLTADWPTARLRTDGAAVGLPDGQMGNSEVGHMSIGAGRVVLQDLPRIDRAIAEGRLIDNPAFVRLVDALRESGGTCHLMGLLSPGGVHAHQDQMIALARALVERDTAVVIHAFLDGRDTPPKSAVGYVERFLRDLPGGAEIGTVAGRYFAMDRDKRWDRIEKAYRAIVEGDGRRAADALGAIKAAYGDGETDEFVTPSVIAGYGGVRDGDAVLMANFRADRARQILTALLDPDFSEFRRGRTPRLAHACGMVSYSEALDAFIEPLFPPDKLDDVLGEIVAEKGLRQLRIAETEKYAHVTFFLNGGEERIFPGENRILIPSPRVATYDLKPEMSAGEVTDKLVAEIAGAEHDLIVVNFANPDMVGHTGKLAAALEAVEFIDDCLGRIADAVAAAGTALVITADHGNIEMMVDPETGEYHTAHTTNLVPIVVVNAPAVAGLRDGSLCDVAPTVLALMGLKKPTAMTGESLLVPAENHGEENARRTA